MGWGGEQYTRQMCRSDFLYVKCDFRVPDMHICMHYCYWLGVVLSSVIAPS